MKMIQIRNVPDELHRKLKARAAMRGTSLSDYLRKEVELLAEQPTTEEILARIRSRKPVRSTETPAQILRQERTSR